MPPDAHVTGESPGDPFAALGLPRRFDLDDQQIETAFLRRIAQAHPDLEPAEGHPDPGGDATADTAILIDARAVLADPERRARALVRLLDPAGAPDRTLPDGFLMEMMELRQRIEEELAADGAHATDARARWEAFAEARRQGHIARFAALAGRSLQSDPDALAQARAELNAWRYTERLIEQLDPATHHSDRTE